MKFASALFAAALIAGTAGAVNASSDDASELLLNASFTTISGTAQRSPTMLFDRDGDSDGDHDGRDGHDDDDNYGNGYDDDDDRGRNRKGRKGRKRKGHDNDDY